jgi:hypothetical protein
MGGIARGAALDRTADSSGVRSPRSSEGFSASVAFGGSSEADEEWHRHHRAADILLGERINASFSAFD